MQLPAKMPSWLSCTGDSLLRALPSPVVLCRYLGKYVARQCLGPMERYSFCFFKLANFGGGGGLALLMVLMIAMAVCPELLFTGFCVPLYRQHSDHVISCSC